MDFKTLTAQIQDTLSRYDDAVTSNIPYFINQAQQRIAREVTLFCLVKSVNISLQEGDTNFDKPIDFVRPLSCSFFVPVKGYPKPIEYRSKEFITAYGNATMVGDPLYYTDFGESPDAGQVFALCPKLMRDLDIYFEYYAYPGDLSVDTLENQLTKSAPNLLLYGSLLECAPFLKEDERITIWQQYYEDAKTMYGATNVASKQDRSRDLMKD